MAADGDALPAKLISPVSGKEVEVVKVRTHPQFAGKLVVQGSDDGFQWTYPMPSIEELQRLYSEDQSSKVPKSGETLKLRLRFAPFQSLEWTQDVPFSSLAEKSPAENECNSYLFSIHSPSHIGPWLFYSDTVTFPKRGKGKSHRQISHQDARKVE